MTRPSKYLTFFILFISLIFPLQGNSEITNISSAINKAGRQRMLSQRIVATYCQIGQNIITSKSKRQLKNAINLFDQQLIELKTFQSSDKIHQQLDVVSGFWQAMRHIAKQPVKHEKAEELRHKAEDVLRESQRVVIMLENLSNSTAGQLVNISGRQRMLSQRLSNLYMMQSWGFSNAEYQGDFSTAISEFKSAMSELKKAPLNTKKINLELNRARIEFAMLERSTHIKTGEYIPLMFKLSADKLLKLMNGITALYEQLAVDSRAKSS